MAGDKPTSVSSLERPAKYQDLLKEDRGDDCLSCRIVGKLFEDLPFRAILDLTHVNRRRRVSRPRGIHLLLGTDTAPAAGSSNPQEQVHVWHAQSADGHHGPVDGVGLVGTVAALRLAVVVTDTAPSHSPLHSLFIRTTLLHRAGRTPATGTACYQTTAASSWRRISKTNKRSIANATTYPAITHHRLRSASPPPVYV